MARGLGADDARDGHSQIVVQLGVRRGGIPFNRAVVLAHAQLLQQIVDCEGGRHLQLGVQVRHFRIGHQARDQAQEEEGEVVVAQIGARVALGVVQYLLLTLQVVGLCLHLLDSHRLRRPASERDVRGSSHEVAHLRKRRVHTAQKHAHHQGEGASREQGVVGGHDDAHEDAQAARGPRHHHGDARVLQEGGLGEDEVGVHGGEEQRARRILNQAHHVLGQEVGGGAHAREPLPLEHDGLAAKSLERAHRGKHSEGDTAQGGIGRHLRKRPLGPQNETHQRRRANQKQGIEHVGSELAMRLQHGSLEEEGHLLQDGGDAPNAVVVGRVDVPLGL
mmetsp:Transcript_4386/g.8275  ORF Transcript_4386/g.8275 Transcript_4386/m.8275 type:complete len:334 (+) Transcript_4386:1777-2778(+)